MFKKYVVKQGVTTLTVNLDTWHAEIACEQYEPEQKFLASHELACWVGGDGTESDDSYNAVQVQAEFIDIIDINMGLFAVACLESVLECIEWSNTDRLILGGNRLSASAHVE